MLSSPGPCECLKRKWRIVCCGRNGCMRPWLGTVVVAGDAAEDVAALVAS